MTILSQPPRQEEDERIIVPMLANVTNQKQSFVSAASNSAGMTSGWINDPDQLNLPSQIHNNSGGLNNSIIQHAWNLAATPGLIKEIQDRKLSPDDN